MEPLRVDLEAGGGKPTRSTALRDVRMATDASTNFIRNQLNRFGLTSSPSNDDNDAEGIELVTAMDTLQISRISGALPSEDAIGRLQAAIRTNPDSDRAKEAQIQLEPVEAFTWRFYAPPAIFTELRPNDIANSASIEEVPVYKELLNLACTNTPIRPASSAEGDSRLYEETTSRYFEVKVRSPDEPLHDLEEHAVMGANLSGKKVTIDIYVPPMEATVAFGAAAATTPREFVAFVEWATENHPDANDSTDAMRDASRCLMWTVERLIRCLTLVAYTDNRVDKTEVCLVRIVLDESRRTERTKFKVVCASILASAIFKLRCALPYYFVMDDAREDTLKAAEYLRPLADPQSGVGGPITAYPLREVAGVVSGL